MLSIMGRRNSQRRGQ